jgi:ATP-dependent exoDNAse (exonuclease V) beta subunit
MLNQVRVGDAILSRANAPLMPLCLSLLRQHIPARIEGRDVGKQLLGIVTRFKAKSIPDFCRKVENWGVKMKKRAGNKEDRCAVINDQVATLLAVAEGLNSVSEIERRIRSLFQDSNEKGARPAVILSSVHKAKGLEWERVYMLEETFKPGKSVEEDNIYYVAITRAKSQLAFVFNKPTD